MNSLTSEQYRLAQQFMEILLCLDISEYRFIDDKLYVYMRCTDRRSLAKHK